MKKIFMSIALVSVLFFSSCYDQTTGDVSSVTNFAVFEYDNFAVVELGSTFTPTASATEGGTDIPVTVTSNVNTDAVGVYTVGFAATNSDGFDANAFQTVVVHDPNIVGTDVSGAIEDVGRPSRVGVISLVEGTTSIFFASDFGFGGTFPVYFQMNGDTISEISQTYVFSATQVDLTYDPVEKRFTTLIHPYGFGYTFQYQ